MQCELKVPGCEQRNMARLQLLAFIARVSALRRKAIALEKQANAFQQAGESINDVDRETLLEVSTIRLMLIPTGGIIPISRKESGR